MKKIKCLLLGLLALSGLSCKMVDQISDTASEF